MAGDMADFKMDMGPYNTRLTMYINRSFYSQPVVGSQGYFLWHTYYPMVSNILRAESNRLNGIPANIYLFDKSLLLMTANSCCRASCQRDATRCSARYLILHADCRRDRNLRGG
jgi:hypothetical protein